MFPTVEAEILVEMRTANLVAEVNACFTGVMLPCLALGQVVMIDCKLPGHGHLSLFILFNII